MITHYTNSKGEAVAIANMPYPHLKAAADKLRRTLDAQPERAEELAAMDTQLAKLDAEYEAGKALYRDGKGAEPGATPFDNLTTAEKRDWIDLAKGMGR